MPVKPEQIGTVWTCRARLYNMHNKVIATCIDTPNAIARTFMEVQGCVEVWSLNGIESRDKYLSRMNKWNTCDAQIIRY